MRCADFQGDVDNHKHRAVLHHRLQAGPTLRRGLRTFCENIKEGKVKCSIVGFGHSTVMKDEKT